MGVTVRQIASSELFKQDIPLLAGESGLDYEVKYVTICNSPVLSISNYNLDDSVFVLTSFSPYHSSVERMIEMVYFLEHQNISALCVKLDSYLGQMPEELIKVCNEIGLPLFAFNDSGIPFRKVILEIDKEIIGGNIAALEQSNQQYAMLYDNIMSGENVDTKLEISQISCVAASWPSHAALSSSVTAVPAAMWRTVKMSSCGLLSVLSPAWARTSASGKTALTGSS